MCPSQALSVERGVAALINGSQIALFRAGSDGHIYAIDNHDPASGANVLSRGIVGSAEASLYVASPMHKHRFDLGTGECLDNQSLSVRVWPVREHAGVVEILIDGGSD